jgi:hypothetical protein
MALPARVLSISKPRKVRRCSFWGNSLGILAGFLWRSIHHTNPTKFSDKLQALKEAVGAAGGPQEACQLMEPIKM